MWMVQMLTGDCKAWADGGDAIDSQERRSGCQEHQQREGAANADRVRLLCGPGTSP